MGGVDGEDPFFWDSHRLINELCSSGSPWWDTENLPDTAQLSEAIIENGADGKDLLTYEDEVDDFGSLCKDLGIKKISHKRCFRQALSHFQNTSPGYRAWKKERSHEAAESYSRRKASVSIPSSVLAGDHDANPTAHGQINGESALPHALPSGSGIDTTAQPSPIIQQKDKKRRIAPVNLSTPPLPTRTNDILTEADVLSARYAASIPGPSDPSQQIWQHSADGAYLGGWALTEDAILGVEPARDASLYQEPINWAIPKPIPAGRRLQVCHTVQRYLRPRAVRLGLGRAGVVKPQAQQERDDEDALLPMFGESDDEYDSETWEEIEKEAAERNQPQPPKKQYLTYDQVDGIITQSIREISDRWSEKKLPKQQRRAYKLWVDARRHGTRKFQIDRALASAKELDVRIAKYSNEIHKADWFKEADVRHQCLIFEQTIEDKLHHAWVAQTLASPTQPPKPPRQHARAAPRRRKLIKVRFDDEDGEVLTSDSDDGLDDFVIQDDGMLLGDTDHGMVIDRGSSTQGRGASSAFSRAQSVAMDSSSFSTDENVTRFDFTQIEESTDDDGRSPMEIVDLTASPPANHTGALENVELPEDLAAAYPFENPAAIAQRGIEFWEDRRDPHRVVITMLYRFEASQRDRLFDWLAYGPAELWRKFCLRVFEKKEAAVTGPKDTVASSIDDVAAAFTRFFHAFTTASRSRASSTSPIKDGVMRRLKGSESQMPEFCDFLQSISGYFPRAVPVSSTPSKIKAEEDSDGMDVDDEGARDASPSHKPKRRIRRDLAAQNLRDTDRARIEAQGARREALRQKLALSGAISRDKTRLIINESKEENQGLIYINDYIGDKIKDHQVAGVRFMWDQIVFDSRVRQGCLLAHTMGLGKTMQVITLLVAIAEAAASRDPAIYSQIPIELRESKTLVLCPPGLVENWFEEIYTWTPPDLLGKIYRIDSSLPPAERARATKEWASDGGVLIMGYHMFKKLVADETETKELLEQEPHIVVADEAHALKNQSTQIHKSTENFRTKTRIAMTGSPLSNSVEEYHSMINWVAPNYLANHKEFVQVYANPIKEGFYTDSTPGQRRKALKMLKVLKDTVAPKVHRATMTALKNELPAKVEFILYLPLTELQQRVYKTFIDHITDSVRDSINSTIQLWNLILNLGLLLAHPKVFRTRLEQMKEDLDRPQQGAQQRSQESLPRAAISNLLATVKQRDIENLEFSSKVVVLQSILDESKKVGDKVLVFSQSLYVLDYLDDLFRRQKRRYSRLDGSTEIKKRQNMVKNFNIGQDEVYLISTTAGGLGLNIHGANRVVIFDFRWNPINEQQAIGRAYRIGQTKPVFVYWLIVGGTYEMILHNQAVFKTQLASRVVDKKNPQAWSAQLRNYTAPPSIMPAEPVSQYMGRDSVLNALLQPSMRDRICKIISTDTFEEEEPEDKLSAEELQEAANLIKLNKLRNEDPQEYERQLAAMQRAALLTSETPPTHHQAQPSAVTRGPTEQLPQTAAPNAPLLDGNAVPTPLQPDPSPAPVSMAFGRDGAILSYSQGSVQFAHPVQGVQQVPELASQQQIQGSFVPPGGGPPNGQAPYVSTPAPPGAGGSERINGPLPVAARPDDFRQALIQGAQGLSNIASITQGRSPEHLVDMLMAELIAAFAALNLQHLPAMSHWAKLVSLATTNANFVEGVLCGRISPQQMASTSNAAILAQLAVRAAQPPRQADPDV